MAYQLPSSLESHKKVGAYRDPRVSFFLQPGEQLVQCSYDKSHWVLTTKILTHLVKCRHNYLNAVKKGSIKVTAETKMEVCPFNTNHHLPHGEMQNHLDNLCESNPFKTDYFQMLDEEKARRDKIAEEEKCDAEEIKAQTGVVVTLPQPRDKILEPKTEHEEERMIKMEYREAKPKVGDYTEIGGSCTMNIKQEKCLDVKVTVGEGSQSRSSSICGSRACSGPGALAIAALLKIKKEEEAQEQKENLEWVRPGPFGDITTPCTKYKDRIKKEAVTVDVDMQDPNNNWELVLPQNQVLPHQLLKPYDSRQYLELEENRYKIFIQNPQGLTKSERRAYHKKYDEEMRRREKEREIEDKTVVVRAARQRKEREREMTLDDLKPKPPSVQGRGTPTRRRSLSAGPTYPGFELTLDIQQNPVEEYEKMWGNPDRKN